MNAARKNVKILQNMKLVLKSRNLKQNKMVFDLQRLRRSIKIHIFKTPRILRIPGPVQFGTCICSYVETILSLSCLRIF